jgi:hypothetical protein
LPWLPVSTGLTPHGLRHGHKTWMDEDRVADVLKSERLGHKQAGMRGVNGHVSPAMREELKAALQARWEDSLRQRVRLAAGSAVPWLARLLASVPDIPRRASAPIWLPKTDTSRGATQTAGHEMPCDLPFPGRGDRI